ncbi:MAG: phospholipid carrier-dependent glycosyltransferase [Actinobacteria bacterium]|nr:phospholipid carrier-dependent glycosyltransferase [Actinomycetota bacterium]MCA1722325.1 phospholipid carrier-dependent glycosyltransferase [Actinomycetota bacterium]
MTATLDRPEAAAPPDEPWRARILPVVDGLRERDGGWVATMGIGLIAGLLRFLRLDIPRGKIFDEIYYACDGQNLARFGVEQGTKAGAGCVPNGQPGFIVHPPVGKWLIALGEKTFGVNEFGWRFSAAVFGTLTVIVLVRLARRMTGSTLLGCLAGLLLTLDGLHFVQSRTSMLDIFLCFFVTAAFACLVLDRDMVRRRLAASEIEGHGPKLGARPWLMAGGLCVGLAIATKWSGLYYLVVLIVLAYLWEVGARRTAGAAAPWRGTVRRSLLPLLGFLVLLPAAIYVLSWTGWFLSDDGYDRHWATAQNATYGFLPDGLRSWWHYHSEMYGFHSHLQAKHPYQSRPWGWLVLARPVSYYYPGGITPGRYGCTVASCSREVLAIGTPAIWWASIPMLFGSAWLWLSRRDWRGLAVLVMVLTSIVPWIPSDLHRRTMFLFYVLPAVPFMCLGLALCAGWILGGKDATKRRRTVGSAVVGGYVALVVLNFAYLYPVLAAQTLSYNDWHARMWFSSWI